MTTALHVFMWLLILAVVYEIASWMAGRWGPM